MAHTAFNSPDLLANLQQNFNTQSQNQTSTISPSQITQMATALLINQYNNSLNLFSTNLIGNDSNKQQSPYLSQSAFKSTLIKKLQNNPILYNQNQQANSIITPISSPSIPSTPFLPTSLTASSSSVANLYNSPILKSNNLEKPKRRSRLGGTSVKTAEVWRFFTQVAPPEQAAVCSLCQKIIKATNSSTTGMIRHLRSCHPPQYIILQEARHSNLIIKSLKNAAPKEALQVLQGFGINTLSFEGAEKLVQLIQSPNSNVSFTSIINSLTSDKKKFVDQTVSPMNSTSSNASLITSSPNSLNLYKKNHTVDSIIDFNDKSDVLSTQQFGNQYLKNILGMFKKSQNNASLELPDKNLSNTADVTVMSDQIKKLQDKSINNKENLLDKLENQFDTQSQLFLHKSNTTDSKEEKDLGNNVKNQNECDGEYHMKSFVNESTFSPVQSIFEEDEKSSLNESSTHLNSPAIFDNDQKSITQNRGVKRVFSEISQKAPLCASTPLNNKAILKEANKLNEQIALMLLMDNNEDASLVKKSGFNRFIKTFFPYYQMPTAEVFCKEIIPNLSSRLKNELQHNNPYGLQNLVLSSQFELNNTKEENFSEVSRIDFNNNNSSDCSNKNSSTDSSTISI